MPGCGHGFRIAGPALAAFLLAGFVKGMVGFGLPTVALAAMALIVAPLAPMAAMLAPSLATHAWQALALPLPAAWPP